MTVFLQWLALSPLASAAKVAAAAALVWCTTNVGDFGLSPVVEVALVAGLPVLVNWLNPEDVRYGTVGEDE